MPSSRRSFGLHGSYTPSRSMTRASTNPHNSSRWCQSRPLRASREASKQSTAPTCPAHRAATNRSKPGRSTVPLADRPEIVVNDLDVGEAAPPRDIDKLVLGPLALKVRLHLLRRRLAHIDDRLGLQHSSRKERVMRLIADPARSSPSAPRQSSVSSSASFSAPSVATERSKFQLVNRSDFWGPLQPEPHQGFSAPWSNATDRLVATRAAD
jgi:hypothetical protein